MCEQVCPCARMCVCMRVHVRVRARVRACFCIFGCVDSASVVQIYMLWQSPPSPGKVNKVTSVFFRKLGKTKGFDVLVTLLVPYQLGCLLNNVC